MSLCLHRSFKIEALAIETFEVCSYRDEETRTTRNCFKGKDSFSFFNLLRRDRIFNVLWFIFCWFACVFATQEQSSARCLLQTESGASLPKRLFFFPLLPTSSEFKEAWEELWFKIEVGLNWSFKLKTFAKPV